MSFTRVACVALWASFLGVVCASSAVDAVSSGESVVGAWGEDAPLAPPESRPLLPTVSAGHMNLSRLREAAGTVFDGLLARATVRDRGQGALVTDCTFQIVESLKNSEAGGEFAVTTLGGELPDGSSMSTSESLRLTIGRRYLVFLRPSAETLALPFLRVLQLGGDGKAVADESGRVLLDLQADGTMRLGGLPQYEYLFYGTPPRPPESVRVPEPNMSPGMALLRHPRSSTRDRALPWATVVAFLRTGEVQTPDTELEGPVPVRGSGAPSAFAADSSRWHYCGYMTQPLNFYGYFTGAYEADWNVFRNCGHCWNTLVSANPSGPYSANDWLLGYYVDGNGNPILNHLPSSDNSQCEAGVLTSTQMAQRGYDTWESLGNPNGIAYCWRVGGECTPIDEADILINPAITGYEAAEYPAMTKGFGGALSLCEVNDSYSIMFTGLATQHAPNYASRWYSKMDDCAGVRAFLTVMNEDEEQTVWVLANWADMAVYAQTYNDATSPGELVMATPSADTVAPGDPLTIENFHVENRGNLPAEDVAVGIYLSTNSTITTSDRQIGLITPATKH